MVVTMNGSPLARPGGFKELQSTTLTRAQREAEKRKAKKAAEEAKFQKRQEAIRQQQNREREERRRAREEGAKIVEAQHEAWEAEQRMREERHRLNVVAGEELTQSKIYESSIGQTLDTSNDWQQKELYRQRAIDEANEAARQAELKAEREAKDTRAREDLLKRAEADARAKADRAARIKKEMEDDFKKKKVVEEEKQSELRQRGLEERKKNDEYSEWLAVDHVRTSLEQVNTRADPSKMHEGGKFRGSPTDFTPGK